MTTELWAVLITILITASLALAIHKRSVRNLKEIGHAATLDAREKEKAFHLREVAYIEERNNLSIAHYQALSDARKKAFEEGRVEGLSLRQHELVSQMAEQRNEFSARIIKERESAALESRDRARAEYELQTKLFSVKISPYVEIIEDKGLFKNTFELKAGYQTQLLVNGIPAFEPHVSTSHKDTKSEFNAELRTALIETARGLASVAIQTYLGGSPQFVTLNPEVVEQRSRAQQNQKGNK